MSDLSMQAPVPHNNSDLGAQDRAADTVSLGRGLVTMLIAVAIISVLGLGVGKLFFWNKYDTSTKLDHEFKDSLAKVQADPTNPLNHVQLGWDYYLLNKNEQAVGEFKKALSLDPKNYAAYYDLGLAYMNEKNYDEAATNLQQAINVVPDAFPPHLNLAISDFKLGKYDPALEELSLAYKANPGSPETMYWRGMVYEKQGKYQDALYQYQTAINFEPNYPEAHDAWERVSKLVKK